MANGITHVIYARYKQGGSVWHTVELPGPSRKTHHKSVLASYKALCGHRFRDGSNTSNAIDYNISQAKPQAGRFCSVCVRKEAQRPPTDPPAASSLVVV